MRLFDYRKKVRRTVSEGSVGRAPDNRDLDPVGETGAGVRTTPDCPLAEGSENMSATNSEVESAMNHRRCRAVLRDPKFSDEALNAFSSGDAYIRAARNGLRKATRQYLTDVQVSFLCQKRIAICLKAVGTTDLRIVEQPGPRGEEQSASPRAGAVSGAAKCCYRRAGKFEEVVH